MTIQELVPVTIDGIKFKIMQFVWKESLRLEKKSLFILAPILDLLGELKGVKETSSLMDLKLDNLGGILQKALMALDDPFDYITEMIKLCYYPKKNKNGIQEILLDNEQDINECFHGKTITAIKLCIEVMKVNKFAFIEGLGGIGSITGIFKNIISETMESSNESEILED